MKGFFNHKLVIVGPYPPPIGGVSMHIQRLHHLLNNRDIEHVIYSHTAAEKKEDNILVPENRLKWWLSAFRCAKETVFHFHSYAWRHRILIGMMGFLGKNVILTIHSEHTIKEQINNVSPVKRAILVFALRNMRLIIAVSPRIKSFLVSLGVRVDRIECIPAYISPVVKTEEIAEIPETVFDFANNHHPVLVANASSIVFFENQDVYGIDMCIDLCSRLKADFPQIGFVFCLPETGDYEYFCEMKQRVRENQLGESFLFQTKACQMYPIIMKSDLFVRPTSVDGYSVSVSEAIHFKIPVVASDVCARPAGTILFKNRDIDDFTFTVKKVLSDHVLYKKEIAKINQKDNAERIIGIYRRLIDDKY